MQIQQEDVCEWKAMENSLGSDSNEMRHQPSTGPDTVQAFSLNPAVTLKSAAHQSHHTMRVSP